MSKPPFFERKHKSFVDGFYKRARAYADADPIKFFALPESTRVAIRELCRQEAEQYPELRWNVRLKRGVLNGEVDINTGNYWSFDGDDMHYLRIDPLPEENEKGHALRQEVLNLEERVVDLQKDNRDLTDANVEFRKQLEYRTRSLRLSEEQVERYLREKLLISERVEVLQSQLRHKNAFLACFDDLLHALDQSSRAACILGKLLPMDTKVGEYHNIGNEISKTYDLMLSTLKDQHPDAFQSQEVPVASDPGAGGIKGGVGSDE